VSARRSKLLVDKKQTPRPPINPFAGSCTSSSISCVGVLGLFRAMSENSVQNSNLIKAAKHGDIARLKNAIKSGADLNSTDTQWWTALSHAAHRGWTEGMKVIIEAGADVNHGRETGFTALLSAVSAGHLEAVQMLLEAGAQARDVQGIRLTGYAQGKKKQQIVALLGEAVQRESISD
jgi:uncharacterized protein